MAKGAITAHEEKLLNLLWSPSLYVVPQYQRNFAWDSEQTSELWGRSSNGSKQRVILPWLNGLCRN